MLHLRMIPIHIVVTLLILSIQKNLEAANWAQTSGYIEQNAALPAMPSVSTKHWQARYGMVTLVLPTATSKTGQTGQIFVFGGDTYGNDFSPSNSVSGLSDNRWGSGYKNDVWAANATTWYVKGDIRLRTRFKQKIPRVQSQMKWVEVTSGLQPPAGTTYETWIECALPINTCPSARHWSPRRHHAGVVYKQTMFIMGGRAREFVELPELRSVGGIVGPRYKDIHNTGPNEQPFSTQREASVYKSDIWSSEDGLSWTLVNKGCKRPWDALVNLVSSPGKTGRASDRCKVDGDCYGSEECKNGYCNCPMWTPREQFAVVMYGDIMIVSGGYTSVLYGGRADCGPYACGDTDASAYRYYLNDVWVSGIPKMGTSWTPVTQNAFSQAGGRGGHSMLLVPDTLSLNSYLWVVGGRGGDNAGAGKITFYNDIWIAQIPRNFTADKPYLAFVNILDNKSSLPWSLKNIPWSPRSGHTTTLEVRFPSNSDVRHLYVVGGSSGVGGDGKGPVTGSFLNDTWVWPLDTPGVGWLKDYTPQELFITSSTKTQSGLVYKNNTPTASFITPDSDLSLLQWWWVPVKLRKVSEQRLQEKAYITPEKLSMLNSVGLYTIRNLAGADKYTILKLRGFDVPQVPLSKRLGYTDICDVRALAIEIVRKCTPNLEPMYLYDGLKNQPRNVVPVFGGFIPPDDNITWHNAKSYKMLYPKVISDATTLVAQWDGCSPIDVSNDPVMVMHGPNVQGIGFVTIPENIQSPQLIEQNLFCKWTPGARAYHSAVFFDEKLYLFGGKSSESQLHADVWYRDPFLPSAVMRTMPKTKSSDYLFEFASNKPGCAYEYRVYDAYNYRELRPWSPVIKKADISWLNWRNGGPGSGLYRLYVRAVDPAGNRDELFIMNSNVYEWFYASPIPWDIIFEVLCSVLGLAIIAYFEYRRRVKKAAMERYAMKRLRRKFKAMQRDTEDGQVDWRVLYAESKVADTKGKGNREKDRRRRERDKKQEAKTEEKRKREKEKEEIKRRLKASLGGSKAVDKMTKKDDKNSMAAPAVKRLKDNEIATTRGAERPGSKARGVASSRYKESEKVGGLGVDIQDEAAGGNKGATRFKQEEQSLIRGGTEPDSGAKNRKPKYKDYEMQSRGEEGERKKDM